MQTEDGDNSPPIETTGLYCFHCEYDLTGLSEDRCPECGEGFDRELLRKIAVGEPIPATPWDTERTVGGFLKTWWLALVQHDRLATRFPLVHDSTAAWQYTLFCYATAWVVLFSLTTVIIPESIGKSIVLGFSLTTGAGLSCLVCESLAAAGLGLLVPPARCRRRYHFWRGLTHYTSGYTWLSVAWAGFAMYVLFRKPNGGQTVPTFFADGIWIAALGIFIWWTSVLWIMICRRGRGWHRILAACVWVVVCGVVSIFFGYIITLFLTISISGIP